MNKFGKVLLLSASAGAGHVRAAQAVEKAFRELGAAEEVRHVDTLDYTNKVFRHLYAKAYLDMVQSAPAALGWLYDRLDQPWQNERRRLALDRLNTRPFVKLLRQYRPDITVCTHFLPAEIISWLKAKERLTNPQAIVVTDFDVHAMWLCHHYEQYFVALEETRVHMERLGIPADKISVSGIPIDPVFSRPKDKGEMRAKHGLAQERVTLLISAGGFGVGSVEHIIEALGALEHAAQVIAVCGRNEELRAQLERRGEAQAPDGRVLLKVIGYTTEMDELMAASDILIGKPGGLTTSETLARGAVLVIVNPIPGQESRNSDYLLENGAAIKVNNIPTLTWKVQSLLADEPRLARLRENARRIGRPRAAYDVAEKALAMARQPV